MKGGSALARIAFLAALALSGGCFVGYDSRWAQQKQAQQHAAQRSTPKQLPSQTAGAPRVARRVLKLRAYATPGYTVSVVDWQKQLGALVERANAVFGPEFGAEFEVEELRTFPEPASEEKLDGLLQQLSALDPASDVDWVVGLAVASPRFAASADDLGIARLPGRHIVLRAMSDVHEYEAITRDFTKISEDERLKLYHVRKLHKLCTTFLHEIAHTLGVPHELSADSLMSPRYHVEASDFSDEAAQIIRASLASRVSPASPVLDAALASQLDASLRAPDSAWEPVSRDAVLAQLTQFSAPPLAKPPAESSASVVSTMPVPGLSPEEQRSFDAARAELSAGRAARARELGAKLFAKYSTVPEVQSLRCDTAMAIGGDWDAINAECPGLSPFGRGR
jgi:hypothetical protein